MELPLMNMLSDQTINIPFCLAWANENWTRRWDGQDNEVLIAQEHSDDDSLDFIRHVIKYFHDKRYIRIDNKPVLIVYRADIIPNISKVTELWRKEVRMSGISDIYLIAAQTFGIDDPTKWGFNAAVEFPPHGVVSNDIRNEVSDLNPEFTGNIFSYKQVVQNSLQRKDTSYKLFRSVMLRWDNTARRKNRGTVFHKFSLLLYKQWLSALVNRIHNSKTYSADEKLVFINAWNEWAEGSYLEPDSRYGFACLKTTYDVISQYDNFPATGILQKNYDSAIIIHVHYLDVWESIFPRLLQILERCQVDIYITVTHKSILKKVNNDLPKAYVILVDNRGRDILPFIEIFKLILPLGYKHVAKVHTKKSIYREDGDVLREELIDCVIGNHASVEQAIERFERDPKIGMLVPKKYLINHTEHNMTYDNELVDYITKKIGIKFRFGKFPAGSMFWFRPQAMVPLSNIYTYDFEIEKGLADGTVAHAIERCFSLIVEDSGFNVSTL